MADDQPDLKISSRDELEAFLKDRTKEDAVAIALRAAWRVMPLISRVDDDAVLKRLTQASFRAALSGQRGQPFANAAAMAVDAAVAATVEDAAKAAYAVAFAADASYAFASDAFYAAAVDAADVAADVASYAAVDAASADIWREVESDCRIIQRGHGPLLQMCDRLWRKQPDWFTSAFVDWQKRLADAGEFFGVIETWFQQVKTNASVDPFPIKALNEIANEGRIFWGDGKKDEEKAYWGEGADNPRTPDIVIADIAERLGWPGAPAVPEDRSGLRFETESGKYVIASTGSGDEDDIAEIEGLRDVILEALEDLASSCQGTNAFTRISRVSNSYRNTLEGEITRVSIDKLYAYGVRLSNANHKLLSDIETGVLPEPGGEIAEALDSVLTLHGPMILGTKRGQELLKRSRDYLLTQQQELEYKERLKAFTDALNSSGLVERDSMDVLDEVTEAFGTGDHPERSNEVAITANRNLLSSMGREALLKTAGVVVAGGVAASASGQAAMAEVSALTDATIAFLRANEQVLRSLAAAGGADFNWVSSLLNWINRRSR